MSQNFMLDSTGRKIREGQIVSIPMNGMFGGQIIKINDSPLLIPGQGQMPPHIVIEVHVPIFQRPGQDRLPNCYIVAQPDEVDRGGGSVLPFKTGEDEGDGGKSGNEDETKGRVN